MLYDGSNELIQSNIALFKDNETNRLLKILKSICSNMKTAYIINWTPEQGEDLYTILIDCTLILKIELNRVNPNDKPYFETFTLYDFKRGLSK